MSSTALTQAEEVVSLFFRGKDGADPPSPPPELRSFSVRLEAWRLAQIDSMAEAADVSRNAMAVRLLVIGINAVMHAMPQEVRAVTFPEEIFQPDDQGVF
jgi:hypothetical protein